MSVFLSSGSPSAERRQPALELRDRLLVDRLLHEQARAGAADVALVEVDAVDDPLDRAVERGVVEDDVRRLAAELERELLARAGELPLDRLADLGRPRERDLVDALVRDERRARRAVAGDDVDDARRELGLAAHIGEEERRQRRRLRGLQHDRVARCERRRDLPGEHQQREVPGDDLAGDAERLRLPVRERVLELVRPARVVEEVRGGERQVDVAALADRLAAVEALEHRELARALLEDPRDAEEVLRALGRRQRRPAVLEGAARRLDRRADVLLTRLGHLRELLLRRGRDGREPLLRPRVDELAADVEAVAVLEPDDVAGLGRRCVLPLGESGRPGLVVLDGHRSQPSYRRALTCRLRRRQCV